MWAGRCGSGGSDGISDFRFPICDWSCDIAACHFRGASARVSGWNFGAPLSLISALELTRSGE